MKVFSAWLVVTINMFFKSNYEQSSAIVTLGHCSEGPDIFLTFCTTFAGLPSLENKKQQV